MATPSLARMRSLPAAAVGGADLDDGEVARAAAEVGDEAELVVVEAGLVVVRRRHRLVLEDDVVEPGRQHGRAQALHRERVVLGAGGVGEVDGPPHHDAAAERAELLLGPGAHVAQQEREQLHERMRAVEDGGALEGAVRQVRLERLHEAALVGGLQVAVDGARARERRQVVPGVAQVRVEVEDGPEGVGDVLPVAEASEGDFAVRVGDADGAVGGPEIEADASIHLDPPGVGRGAPWRGTRTRRHAPRWATRVRRGDDRGGRGC